VGNTDVRAISGHPHVRWNYLANMFDGALYGFALSFISLTTVLPVFVQRLGGSNLAVGLVQVIWILGFHLPQILIANYARSLPFKKPFVLRTAFVQRLPWLLLGLLSFFLVGKIPQSAALALFFVGLAMAAVTGSINLPGWFDMVAKVIPVRLRGRLFAMRSILGAGLGIGGGWLVHLILDRGAYPYNFGYLFTIAYGITMVSYIFVALIKETEPTPPPKRLRYGEYLRQLPSILRREKNFRNFLVGDALLTTALMGNAFYTVHALQRFTLPDAIAGRFTMVLMVSMIFGSPVFGTLADRLGHRLNLLLAAGFSLVASSLALMTHNLSIYYIVFACIAFMTGIIQVSRLTIIAELCGERDRPTYIALANLITAPFALSGMFGGLLADRFGYPAVFVVAGATALGALLWFAAMVREPRHVALQPQPEGFR
jgi:MFS family permease